MLKTEVTYVLINAIIECRLNYSLVSIKNTLFALPEDCLNVIIKVPIGHRR